MTGRKPWGRSAAAAAALSLASAGIPAAAQPPAAPPPAAPPAPQQQQQRVSWEVDWGEQYCTLARVGLGADSVTFGIRTIPGSDWLDIVMISEAWRSFPVSQGGSATVRLLPSGRTFVTELTGTAVRANGNRAIILRSLTREVADALRDSERLQVEQRGRVVIDLPIPPARTAARALQQCIDDVLRQWGVDPVALAALRTRPNNRSGNNWFRPNDYPTGAAERGTSGTVVTRLRVDARGRVEDCDVVGRSGEESLDRVTCQVVMRRGRFDTPAIGADGQPVPISMIFVVSWYVSGF